MHPETMMADGGVPAEDPPAPTPPPEPIDPDIMPIPDTDPVLPQPIDPDLPGPERIDPPARMEALSQ